MSEFEFFFSFFGLLLGLSVAEVSVKLADSIGARHRVVLGWLTPLLAAFVLADIASFWMWSWANRGHVTIAWSVVFGALVMAVTYFLAAALVFPRRSDEWQSLDEHYWAHKRLVIGGIMIANALIVAFTLVYTPPTWSDWQFFLYQSLYWLPLAALLFTRAKAADLVLLVWLLVQYVIASLNLLGSSNWGATTGL